MAYMRSTIAFGLLWLNLIIISLIMYFSFNIFEHPKQRSYRNLRGVIEKEKLQLNYFKYQLQAPLIKKDLRNLSASFDFDKIILYVDIGSIFFLLILMFSFCLKDNECCTSDPNTNREFAIGSCYGACICCSECQHSSNNIVLSSSSSGSRSKKSKGGNSGGGGGDDGLGLLILLIIVLAFIATYIF